MYRPSVSECPQRGRIMAQTHLEKGEILLCSLCHDAFMFLFYCRCKSSSNISKTLLQLYISVQYSLKTLLQLHISVQYSVCGFHSIAVSVSVEGWTYFPAPETVALVLTLQVPIMGRM